MVAKLASLCYMSSKSIKYLINILENDFTPSCHALLIEIVCYKNQLSVF